MQWDAFTEIFLTCVHFLGKCCKLLTHKSAGEAAATAEVEAAAAGVAVEAAAAVTVAAVEAAVLAVAV